MKIAFDHQIFGLQRFGGISRYFFELANNLAKLRTDPVAIISPLYVNSYLDQADKRLQVLGKQVPAIRRSGRIFRGINQLIVPGVMHKYKPDIVHETYYSNKRLAPRKSKIVLTVFDMIQEIFPQYLSAGDPVREEKAAAVKRADHIICISENTRHDLINILGVEKSKTTVVHLGVSFTKAEADLSNFEPNINSKPYLLYVGARGGYKNFENLLRAYASHREVFRDFDLVTFGGGAFTPQEEKLMCELGFADSQVRQIGGGDRVLANLYTEAALFVYPSLYEGFGLPPLEAMSFDCPVICSNTSSLPEIAGNAAMYFDPSSFESIGDAMGKVLCDSDLRHSLIGRGRERLNYFSWDQCAEDTNQVYERIMS